MNFMVFTRGFLFGCIIALLFAACASAGTLTLSMNAQQRIGERAGLVFNYAGAGFDNATNATEYNVSICRVWISELNQSDVLVHEYHYSPQNPASYALVTDGGGHAAFTILIDDAYTVYGDYVATASCSGALDTATFTVLPADATVSLGNWYLMALQNAPLALFAVILVLGLLFLLGYFGFR